MASSAVIRIIGFNEAGAIRPRKAIPLIESGVTMMRSFNEAGAIRPRKERQGRRSGESVHASMRPGRLGPGRTGQYGWWARFFQCFNEAGAIRPRKGSA